MDQNYKYIPPLQSSRLNFLYDLTCSLGGLGRKFKRKVIDVGDFDPGDIILDDGCGTGVLLQELKRKYPDIKVIGIDPDRDALERTAKRMSPHKNVELINAFAEKLPLADNSVTGIFCTLTLHHMPDEIKKRAIQEMNRVLVSGGKIVIADFGPTDNGFLRWYINRLETPEYIESNFKGLIPTYIKEIGFTDIKIIKRRSFSVQIITAKKQN